MIKIILLVIVATIVIFLIVASFQPADFRISRSITIAAPPSVVFDQLNDFHKWEAWSPWAKMDPAAKNSFDGPTSGVGSKFAWVGNNEVGEGNMTVQVYKPNEFLGIRLEFIKPFAAVNTAEFTLKPEAASTVLTWTMYGTNSFMAKAVVLVMNCDKMVGGQFEKGLADIKALSEALAGKNA